MAMTLDQYLRDASDTAEALASRVGVSAATISRVRKGTQNISLSLANKIAQETRGLVTLEDLAIGLAA